MGSIKRRIEKSAEATINVGEMQFLKIKSMVSQDIDVETEEEAKKEDARLWSELTFDLRRGMWTLLKGMGKTTEADKKFFSACEQRVQEAQVVKQPEGKAS